MALFFARLEEDPTTGTTNAKVEVVRTVVIGVIGAIMVLGVIVLFAMDKTGAANALLHVAEAFLFGAFGLVIGETRGAQAAANR